MSDRFPQSFNSPHIFDSDMVAPMHDGDLEFFNSALPQDSPGQFFGADELANSPYQSPIIMKPQPVREQHPSQTTAGSAFPASPASSSQDSASDSSGQRKRKVSSRSSRSGPTRGDTVITDESRLNSWKDSNLSTGEATIFEFAGSAGAGQTSFDFSDGVMERDFDFDTAASSPSPNMNSSAPAYNGPRHIAIPYHASPKAAAGLNLYDKSSSLNQENSPLDRMIGPQARIPNLRHSHSSPSSSNEEYINGALLNSMDQITAWPSYGNPNVYGGYTTNNVPSGNDPLASTALPQASSQCDSPLRNVPPVLVIHQTPQKSRVETQIPIKMTLYPMPQGVSRLHLPTHTISKPKLVAKPTPAKSPDMLELHTMLVCTSAMQDLVKRQRALTRAAEPKPEVKVEDDQPESSDSSPSAEDDERKPLNGGEVNICQGCILREQKRASRKKTKKPEEEESWKEDEAKRVIVFNTSEIKEWQSPLAPKSEGDDEDTGPPPPHGAMQIDLPMRIACYCRHQNEKLGFQVIFTLKDYKDNLVAQALTNSIVITDDHKTHAPPTTMPSLGSMFMGNAQVPGGGIFTREPLENYSAPFRTAQSTSDLQRLQQSFNAQFGPQPPMPFTMPQNSSQVTSTTLTPRNLSRQASPTAPSCPLPKRRKASGSGKLPDGLTMTKIQTQPGQNMSNQQWTTAAPPSASQSAVVSPYTPNFPMSNNFHDRPRQPPMSRSSQLSTNPPTPTSNEGSFFSAANRSRSMDNFSSVQQMISAPNSNHPSRAPSPIPLAHGTVIRPNVHGHATANSLFAFPMSFNPQIPPTIHKLIPGEGTKAGGIEVTCLGSGFCQGLEVMFGDRMATTTTYWGETSLVCLLPPSPQAGTVPVMFKHQYQQHVQGQRYPSPPIPKQQVLFKYVDDDEQEILKLALALVHQKMTGRYEDAGEIARRIINAPSAPPGPWPASPPYGNDQSRQVSAFQACFGGALDLEAGLVKCLDLMDLDDSPFQAQLNARRVNWQSMLHLSASLGYNRLVAGLLARGANPDLQDRNGMSPMHMAALNGHPQIIRRLRVARGDPTLRSLLGFTPGDMATSQEAHRSTRSLYHLRSRSANSISNQSHYSSTASLQSLWDPPTFPSEIAEDSRLLSDLSDESSEEYDRNELLTRQGTIPAQLWARSRRASTVEPTIENGPVQLEEPAGMLSPAAAMTAWRDQLAAQIQHFQQNVNWTIPQLQIPSLPPMPNLPDYQAYPMVRRFSALVPQRGSRPSTSSSGRPKEAPKRVPESKENDCRWWELITGAASSPPSYEEIYPANAEERLMKTSTATRAAVDALVDQKCSTVFGESSALTVSNVTRDYGSSSQQHNQLRIEQACKVKRLRSDRNLFFIWIPLLVLVLMAMCKDRVPQLWHNAQEAYEMLKQQYHERVVEVV